MLGLLCIVKTISLQLIVLTELGSETETKVAAPILHLENMLLENSQTSHRHTCF